MRKKKMFVCFNFNNYILVTVGIFLISIQFYFYRETMLLNLLQRVEEQDLNKSGYIYSGAFSVLLDNT